MTLAPFLLGALLLLASGLLKLRASARAGLGAHLPSALEVVVGLALGVVPLAGGAGGGVGLAALGLALLLLLGSSLHLVGRLRRRSRLRERTEGRRLETYLRYLSDHDDGGS